MTEEKQKNWRLVYKNGKVELLLEAPNAETLVPAGFTLFTADTKEECLAKIEELGLIHSEIS